MYDKTQKDMYLYCKVIVKISYPSRTYSNDIWNERPWSPKYTNIKWCLCCVGQHEQYLSRNIVAETLSLVGRGLKVGTTSHSQEISFLEYYLMEFGAKVEEFAFKSFNTEIKYRPGIKLIYYWPKDARTPLTPCSFLPYFFPRIRPLLYLETSL